MFNQMTSLESIDLSNWDTSHFTTVAGMFNRDYALTSVNLTGWNTSNVTVMRNLFFDTTSLTDLDLSNLDMTALTPFQTLLKGSGVQKLTLGTQTVLTRDGVTADLADVPTTDGYNGHWINTEGQQFTSAELMALYNGTDTAVEGTYVWQTDQTTLDVHDTSVTQTHKTTWTAVDNFTSATDALGKSLTAADLATSGDVDLTKAGTYTVTYTAANGQTKTATITVIASQAGLNVHDMTVTKGANWTAQAAFAGATDLNGQPLSLTDITVTGADQVDTQKVGQQYQVTYSYTYANDNPFSRTITVTIADTQVNVLAHDTTLTQGQAWTATDSLTDATDADGNVIDLDDVTVTGTVDTKIPGQYPVTFSYTDVYGNTATANVIVTIVATKASVNVKDSSLTAGKSWTAADNFVSATDVNGQPLTLADITVTGANQVMINTPGNYTVTYSYTDSYGNVKSAQASITVTAAATNPDDNNQGETGETVDPETPTKPDTGDNGGNTTTPTNPDTGNNGGNTTTPTNPDTGDNGGQTTTPTKPDAGDDSGDTITPSEPDTTPTTDTTAGDTINPGLTTKDHPSTPTIGTETADWDGDAINTTTPSSPAKSTPVTLSTTATTPVTQVAKMTTANDTVTAAKSTHTAKPAATALPQTDEKTTATSVLGLMLLSASALIATLGKGRRIEK
ncbi:bacterial Ig-like domain-containing protein [Lactiplantibacillus mudanjiangensis]|uniref:bacterial Ig-like domain-containing protein n=1 Tax=Lactiplantibacillus mudanjiangensis TaxID=1296538 RepID=UPI0010325A05